MEIDPQRMSVRDIRTDRCVIYRVFAALRDAAWGTPAATVRSIERRPYGFAVRADYFDAGFGLETAVTVDADQTSIRVGFRATVVDGFDRNRLGLCVLLPGTLAGCAYTAHTRDGRIGLTLPDAIAPHQPCTDLTGITLHAPRVSIEFSGDLFEMEDQRNWSDYSYKLYSTPLRLPFPVRLEPGTIVEQAVTIRAESTVEPKLRSRRAGAPRQRAAGFQVPDLPALGTRAVAAGALPARLPVDFIRVDVGANGADGARSTRSGPGATDPPLDSAGRSVPVHLYEISGAGECRTPDPSAAVDTIAMRAVVDRVSASVRPVAHADFAESAILIGTDGAFAELNRSRPIAPAGATVVFTVSPQVHDTDDQVVYDNLFGLRAVLASAAALYPDARIAIGLLELTPHFNPAAGDYDKNARLRSADPRLETNVALVWGFAAFCEAVAARVVSVCAFDATGPHGVYPDWGVGGPAGDGEPRPVAALFADVARLRAGGGPFTVEIPPVDPGPVRRYRLAGSGGQIVAMIGGGGCDVSYDARPNVPRARAGNEPQE